MAVENNQAELVLLKEEALDLGIEFSDKIGYATLKGRVDARLEEIAQKQRDKKEAKEVKQSEKKVKVIIEPRDSESSQVDQFFGFNGQNILVKFGEEVEITESMYKFIKGIHSKTKVFKMGTDSNGEQRKIWSDKKETRFFVELVD